MEKVILLELPKIQLQKCIAAVECGDPPNFHDGTKCGGQKLPPGKKRCDWNDAHEFWGDVPVYNTNVTYECPEGYVTIFV